MDIVATETPRHHLQRACELVGGQLPLANAIGESQSQVWYWLNKAKKGVPGEVAIKIETATEGRVTKSDLRPDLFPPETKA